MRTVLYIIISCCLASCGKENPSKLVLFQENKQLQMRNGMLFYKGELFSGTLKSFDEISQTNNRANYLNGKKHGEERKYFLNDSLAEIRFYQNGLKVGIHKSWRVDGRPKFEYSYRDGVYHGLMKEWYSSGQLVKEFNYVNGKESGTQRMWLSNGNIKANYTVVNGERFGLIGLKKCYTVKTNESK